MSWRPEGWVTLKPKSYPLHCLAADDCVASSFEAGADALLKEIRKQKGVVLTDKDGKELLVLEGVVYIPPDDDKQG